MLTSEGGPKFYDQTPGIDVAKNGEVERDETKAEIIKNHQRERMDQLVNMADLTIETELANKLKGFADNPVTHQALNRIPVAGDIKKMYHAWTGKEGNRDLGNRERYVYIAAATCGLIAELTVITGTLTNTLDAGAGLTFMGGSAASHFFEDSNTLIIAVKYAKSKLSTRLSSIAETMTNYLSNSIKENPELEAKTFPLTVDQQ